MKVLGGVLLGLAGFLLTIAVLAVTWLPGEVKKTPLDVDVTTGYVGDAAKIDAATGAFVKRPVFVIYHAVSDDARSSDDHILFGTSTCVVFDTGQPRECVDGDNPNLVSASIDVFATDRVTAEAVSDENLPSDAGPHEGLINKFPFDVQKKTYPFWDATIAQSVDMKYDGTESIEGLETYRFVATVTNAKIDVAEGVPGTYSNTTTVNVDPKTGSIVKGGQEQQRFLADGTPVLDLSIVNDDKTITTAVDDAKTAGSLLTLVTVVVPIVGFAGGAVCLFVGILLLSLRQRSGGERRVPATSSRELSMT